MKLKMINSKTLDGDDKLLDIELELINDNYQLSYTSTYSKVSDIFEDSVNNISVLSKISKVFKGMTNIKKSLYGVFDSLGKINYGDAGLMTSHYYQSSEFSPLTFDFVIENKSINYKDENNRKQAESEFETLFSKLLYFSLFKKSNSLNENVTALLNRYYDNNINKLLSGIEISNFVANYIKTEYAKTGLVGTKDTVENFKNNLSYKDGNRDDKIANWLDKTLATYDNLTTSVRDLEYYTPETVFIQLYETDKSGTQHYLFNSLNDTIYNKDLTKIPEGVGDFFTKLKDKGAFLFNIQNLIFEFDETNFVKHTNGNHYPTLLKGKIILKNSRGVNLNESEQFFMNYFNVPNINNNK